MVRSSLCTTCRRVRSRQSRCCSASSVCRRYLCARGLCIVHVVHGYIGIVSHSFIHACMGICMCEADLHTHHITSDDTHHMTSDDTLHTQHITSDIYMCEADLHTHHITSVSPRAGPTARTRYIHAY